MTSVAPLLPSAPSSNTRLGRLRASSPLVFALVAGTAGFATYFAMYAIRKPIAAAQFAHIPGWDFTIDYKTCLIIAQVLGYALSKFLGIKIIAEFGRRGRAYAIVALIFTAWLALVLFAVVPTPWNIALLFLNGLPLGMIWGLVFSYMEGRRISEMLGAILCASFIVSSGVVKSVGAGLMTMGVSPFWMPAATGVLFFPLLIGAVTVLEMLPPPDAEDERLRAPRVAMHKAERSAFIGRHGALLLVLVLAYVLITALRDFRDNFAAELWSSLGYAKDPGIFSASEIPIGIVVLAVLATLTAIQNNRHALLAMHALIIFGGMLLAVSTWAFQAQLIDPLAWMILTGAGLYLAYTPFSAMLFDRLIALFGQPGNAGFLIYVADTAGYAGSVALLLYRSIAAPRIEWVNFLIGACYATAAIIIPLALLAAYRIRGEQQVERNG
jgi:MFS family permease